MPPNDGQRPYILTADAVRRIVRDCLIVERQYRLNEQESSDGSPMVCRIAKAYNAIPAASGDTWGKGEAKLWYLDPSDDTIYEDRFPGPVEVYNPDEVEIPDGTQVLLLKDSLSQKWKAYPERCV